MAIGGPVANIWYARGVVTPPPSGRIAPLGSGLLGWRAWLSLALGPTTLGWVEGGTHLPTHQGDSIQLLPPLSFADSCSGANGMKGVFPGVLSLALPHPSRRPTGRRPGRGSGPGPGPLLLALPPHFHLQHAFQVKNFEKIFKITQVRALQF